MSNTETQRVFCKIRVDDLRKMIVGNNIRINHNGFTFTFHVSPFIEKYLRCGGCAGCGLRIKYAQVMRAEQGARPKLYFFGERLGGMIQFTKDHCIPLAAGGPNVVDNIQPMCSHCNTFKGDSLSMNPIMWILRKTIEFEATIERYQQLFGTQQINEETYARRMAHVNSTYGNMKRKAQLLFNFNL